jgi:hypothetical protein
MRLPCIKRPARDNNSRVCVFRQRRVACGLSAHAARKITACQSFCETSIALSHRCLSKFIAHRGQQFSMAANGAQDRLKPELQTPECARIRRLWSSLQVQLNSNQSPIQFIRCATRVWSYSRLARARRRMPAPGLSRQAGRACAFFTDSKWFRRSRRIGRVLSSESSRCSGCSDIKRQRYSESIIIIIGIGMEIC